MPIDSPLCSFKYNGIAAFPLFGSFYFFFTTATKNRVIYFCWGPAINEPFLRYAPYKFKLQIPYEPYFYAIDHIKAIPS